MSDELNQGPKSNNVVSENKQPNIPDPSALGSTFKYSPAPIIPDWIKKRTAICGYEDGCDNTVDPNEGALCPVHSKSCNNCHIKFNIDDMKKVEIEGDDYFYCLPCYSKIFTECPNCKETVSKNELLLPGRRNTYSMKNGGCDHCSYKCEKCGKIVDNEFEYNHEGDKYCEDCYSETFGNCDSCGETMWRNEEGHYVEGFGEYCDSCYNDKFIQCKKCDIEAEKDEDYKIGNDYYCATCFEEMGPAQYVQYTENFSQFSYTKKDKYLNLLSKLLPISVKDLKVKHQNIAAGLSDLFAFSKGQLLTQQLVKEYRNSLSPEEFPVDYTVWEGVQRSVDTLENMPTDKPQLVINIISSNQMNSKLLANPAIYDLFQKINFISKKSEHPYVANQIGWARVELDPAGEFILVDEIQCDHSNALSSLKTGDNKYYELIQKLKLKYNLDDKGFNAMLAEYYSILKDFPNIASQAVTNFARKNNFKKIFWHTYEGGKKLKESDPPKSLYDKTPKENFFSPSLNKPFGLQEEFFEREASKANALYKLAKRIYLKYIIQ